MSSQNLAHGATQAKFLHHSAPSLQPAPHLKLERVGTFARRVHNNSVAEPEKASCFWCRERYSTLRMISCVAARMGGLLLLVVCRVCLPCLFGAVCAVLNRAGGIVDARGKSAFASQGIYVRAAGCFSSVRCIVSLFCFDILGPQRAEWVSRGLVWHGGAEWAPERPRESGSIFPASRARLVGHESKRSRGRAPRAARRRPSPAEPGPARKRTACRKKHDFIMVCKGSASQAARYARASKNKTKFEGGRKKRPTF